MKKIIEISAILFLTMSMAVAQCPVDLNLTTNPDPAKYNVPSDPNKSRIFDWMNSIKYDVYVKYNGTIQHRELDNPFTEDITGNPNIEAIRDATFKEFFPEDGWEVIIYNFGTPSTGVDNPYLVLYNKYSGTLRVLSSITNTPPGLVNGGIITLQFPDGSKRSAILNHLGSTTNSLNQFDGEQRKRVPNKFQNATTDWWIFADFQILYDPCTCVNSSELQIYSHLIQQFDLFFTTTGTIQEKTYSIQSSGESSIIDNSSFFTTANSIFKAGENIFKAGEKGFKDGEKFANSMLKFANNTKIGNYVDKSLCSCLLGSAGTWAIAPEVGAAIGVANSLNSLIKKLSPQKPAEPVLTSMSEGKVNLESSGNFKSVFDIDNFNFAVPGSDQSVNVPDYKKPLYNNVLGVFNLFETPVIEAVHFKYDGPTQMPIKCRTTTTDINCNAIHSDYKYADLSNLQDYRIKQYKVKNDLKYMVNPAANLEVVDIKVCMVFETKDNSISKSIPLEIAPDNSIPLEDRLNQLGYTVELFGSNPLKPMDGARIATQYVNPNCFTNSSFILVGDDETSYLGCRVKVIFKPKNPVANSKVENMIMIYTFPTTINQLSDIYTFTAKSINDCQFTIEECVSFSTRELYTKFHGEEIKYEITGFNTLWTTLIGQPYNLILENTELDHDITALGTITIKNGVTVKPGSTITITAGERIIVEPTVTLDPTVTLQIDNLNPCDDVPYGPVDDPTISAFCNSSTYQALSLSKREDGFNPNHLTVSSDNSFLAHPNAFEKSTIFYYTITQGGAVRFYITDVMGREVAEVVNASNLDAGEHQANFDGKDLAPGIYFYTLEAGDFKSTKKLVKLK